MKNMKKTRKAFYASLTAMVLCCAMFMGTTYAWFTDIAANTNNRIVAGILDIELYQITPEGEEPVTEDTDFFEGIKWEPGAVYYKNLTIKNEGDLALKYELAFNWGDYNTLIVDGESCSLKEVLKVAVVEGHIDGTGDEGRQEVLTKATEAGWNGFTEKLKGEMAGKTVTEGAETIDADNFAIIIYWEPTDSDSNYNVSNGRQTSDGAPLYVKLGLTLAATQNAVEADSFGTMDYDSKALFPVTDEESFLAALEAATDGGIIVIEQPVKLQSAGETNLNNISLIGDKAGTILKIVSGALNMEQVTAFSNNGIVVSCFGGKVVIQSGTFDGAIETKYESSEVNINGGTFTNFSVMKDELATVIITGGTFDRDPSVYVDLEKYTVTQDNDNNTWTVAPVTVNN